jgi:hypothetical protein
VVVLLDRSLQAQTVDIRRIAQGKIFFTAPGASEESSVPLDSIVAITEPGWWSGDYAAGSLSPVRPGDSTVIGQVELVDGRVVQGRPDLRSGHDADASDAAAAEPPKDILRWEHPELGRLEFKLEEVRRIRMPGEFTPPPAAPVPPPAAAGGDAADRDLVLLTNGDRLSGFVERVGAEVWISEGGAVTKVALSRVGEIRLVNPAVRPEGTMAWLQGPGGGSIIRVEHVGADPQKGLLLGIEPASGKSRQVFLPADQVRALAPSAQRLVPLSSLKITRQEPARGRAYSDPVRPVGPAHALMGVRDLELPGPMSVEWEVTEGAARVGGWIVLPAAFQEWGDCLVRIEAVGVKTGPLVEERVSAASPTIAVNTALPPGTKTLRITIDPGAYGPIQDRIVLHRFVIVK